MKHLTAGFVSSALLLSAVLTAAPAAFAQDAAQSTGTAVVVADVGFDRFMIHHATTTRAYTVQADIHNSLGNLSSAVFGLELLGPQGVLDAGFSTERFSLGEGGTTTQSASLQIPNDVSGKVTLIGVVTSPTGITLAAEPIWSGEVKAVPGSAPLTCKLVKTSSVSCSVGSGQYALVYHVYSGGFGGRDLMPEVLEGAGGKTFSVPNNDLPSGSYTTLIHLSGANGTVLTARTFSLFVPGDQGKIDTFILQDQNDGSYLATLTLHAMVASSTGYSLSLQGQKDGVACGTPQSLTSSSTVIQTIFRPGCAATAVFATLSAGGKQLDTASAVIFPRTGLALGAWVWPVAIGVAVLVILGLIGYVISRRRSAPPSAPPAVPPTPANPITYA